MKVKATRTGYTDHLRRREDDVFSIPDQPRRDLFPGEKALVDSGRGKAIYDRIKDKDGKVPQSFSFRWMEPVAAGAPEKTTSAPQALRKHHDTVIAERAQAKGGAASTGDADVI